MRRKIVKISKFLLIFSVITVWIFGGWPQIRVQIQYKDVRRPYIVSFRFPPEIKRAYAATSSVTVLICEVIIETPAASVYNFTIMRSLGL